MVMHEAVSLCHEPGTHDLWEFASLDVGCQLRCIPLWRLVAYACSKSAFTATAASLIGPRTGVNVTIYGPVADDGRRHFVRRQVSRYECLHHLPREHAREFNRALFRLIRQGKEAGDYPSQITATKVATTLGLPPQHGS